MRTYKLKDVTVTEEEIKRLAIEAGIVESEKVDKPYGELYKWNESLAFHANEDLIFGFEICEGSNINWHLNEWAALNELSVNYWRPANENDRQRWKELLLEKAESMGYENGNYECLIDPSDKTVINNNRFFYENGNVWHNGECLGKDNKKVFNGTTGEWAEIIKKTSVQDTYDQLDTKQQLITMHNALAFMSSNNAQSELDCVAKALGVDNYDKDEEFTAY